MNIKKQDAYDPGKISGIRPRSDWFTISICATAVFSAGLEAGLLIVVWG